METLEISNSRISDEVTLEIFEPRYRSSSGLQVGAFSHALLTASIKRQAQGTCAAFFEILSSGVKSVAFFRGVPLGATLDNIIPYSFTATSHVVVTTALGFSLFIGITIVGLQSHGTHLKIFV